MSSSQEDFGAAEARKLQPLRHETSADNRHCTCEQIWQTNKPQSRAWRNPLEFSVGFSSCLFRNSGVYMYYSYCCKYGGLSFSVAYFTVMAVFGLPTVILLAAVGQQSRFGPLRCWSFSPAIKGVGVAIMLISALHTAPNMVVASEGVYMAIVLLESFGVFGITARGNSTNSPLLSGFFFKRIHRNISLADCEALGLGEVQPDWGICGEVDSVRLRYSTQKELKNHYLWKRVGVFDSAKAAERFAGPKLQTTDLLTGKMRRGFRMEGTMKGPVHWTLLTFVFTLAYCCLLLTLMVDPNTLRTWLHCLSLASTACLGVVSIVTFSLSDGDSFRIGLKEFVSSRRNLSVTNNLGIWADAAMLVMWNTGCSSGELINLAKLNVFGQDFISSSLVSLSVHCLANSLHVLCQEVILAGVRNKEADAATLLKQEAHGYAHILMQLQPYVLSTISYGLSVTPLVGFAVGEVCDIVSFLACCVDSLVEVWSVLKSWTGVLHLLLFCLLVALCLPLCMQYGGAAVYNFLYTSWGWNCTLALTIQLAGLWHFLGPSGATVLFKHLGITEQLSRLTFWWRICWFFYTPVVLLLSLGVLIMDSVKFAAPDWIGTDRNPVLTGPLQNLSIKQMKSSLADWWLLELLRGLTLLPVPVMAFVYWLSKSSATTAEEEYHQLQQRKRQGQQKQQQPMHEHQQEQQQVTKRPIKDKKRSKKQLKHVSNDVWKEIATELNQTVSKAKQN